MKKIEMDEKTTVLLTGANGFLGSYILSLLGQQDRYYISALHRSELEDSVVAGIPFEGAWVQGDLQDTVLLKDLLSKSEIVIHCAGRVSFDRKDRKLLLKDNVQSTANLVNMALEASIQRFVHVSSTAALGKDIEKDLIDEKVEWSDAKTSFYGYTKYLAELEVWRGAAEGLKVVIVNPSVILGSGDWSKGSLKLFKYIYDGNKYYVEGTNGFVDVRDVARFVQLIIEGGTDHERYILNGANLSYKELFSGIQKNLGYKPNLKKASIFLQELIYWLFWVRSKFTNSPTLLTRESILSARRNTKFDNRKSLSVGNFTYTEIEQTIKDSCKKILVKKGRPPGSELLSFNK